MEEATHLQNCAGSNWAGFFRAADTVRGSFFLGFDVPSLPRPAFSPVPCHCEERSDAAIRPHCVGKTNQIKRVRCKRKNAANPFLPDEELLLVLDLLDDGLDGLLDLFNGLGNLLDHFLGDGGLIGGHGLLLGLLDDLLQRDLHVRLLGAELAL